MKIEKHIHHTIRITALECYKSLLDNVKDIAMDMSLEEDNSTGWQYHAKALDLLLAAHRGHTFLEEEDVTDALRNLFKEGFTIVMLPQEVTMTLDEIAAAKEEATIIIEGEGQEYKIPWDYIQW